MTRSDILILALHAVFLLIWFFDSKAMDWYRMHLSYRRMIKKMNYTTRQLGLMKIHESEHDRMVVNDLGFGIEQKTMQKNSHFRDQWKRSSANHPAGRGRPGHKNSGMFESSRDGMRRNARRKPIRQSIFVRIEDILSRDDRNE